MNQETLTISKVLEEIPRGALGYVTGPDSAGWFRRLGTAEDGPTIDWGPGAEPANAFELVAFNGAVACHWIREGEASGRMVTRALPSSDAAFRREGALLSGRCRERRNGWSYMQDQRGARYWLPFDLDAEQRAVLVRMEVLEMDEVGNVRVTAVLPLELKSLKEWTR